MGPRRPLGPRTSDEKAQIAFWEPRWHSVHELLTRHRIRASEEEIARAMEVALVESGFQRPYPEPRRALKREQAELLERGGFELDRLEFGLEDPIARTAFEYAVLRATGLTTHEAAKRLRVNDSRVLNALRMRALRDQGRRWWRLPAFQFARPGSSRNRSRRAAAQEPEPRGGLPLVPHAEPGPRREGRAGRALSPLQWLQTGNDPDVVAELAAGL
jgi:hypothetical protein